ncbi:hypothetical protein [Nocardioides sp. ChNu-99]|uniref:hypothetical protein n=1 Tax=Nocardioides sp. ChNu-99 TaxID=2839897 RepID=UPI0024066F9B|nr:hypothetical protein [Nocardioides sp. ChNu-99]MDF9717375.1 hypothetical protein [Nocardioides sp. ChNu-99]
MPETTQHPSLTAEEFAAGCGYTYGGVPLCEEERAEWVFAYGHVDPDTFAAAVNAMDLDLAGEALGYEAAAVEHRWAITTIPASSPEGWWITWADDGAAVTAETPGAFPITVVSR